MKNLYNDILNEVYLIQDFNSWDNMENTFKDSIKDSLSNKKEILNWAKETFEIRLYQMQTPCPENALYWLFDHTATDINMKEYQWIIKDDPNPSPNPSTSKLYNDILYYNVGKIFYSQKGKTIKKDDVKPFYGSKIISMLNSLHGIFYRGKWTLWPCYFYNSFFFCNEDEIANKREAPAVSLAITFLKTDSLLNEIKL